MNSNHEIRFTDTNSADDSAGSTWGLEGNLFWYLIGGGFASVMTMLLLFSMWRWSLLSALVPAAAPISVALLYVLVFRQGRPSGYDTDLFELWLKGPGFGPKPTAPLEPGTESSSRHV